MITTRIATAAAILTFGLAGLCATVVAIAAPAHADTATITRVDGTPKTGTAGPAIEGADSIPHELESATRGPNVTAVPTPGSAATQQHVLFPHNPAPHSDHDGQGHKGSNEQHNRH
ncbi:hypothetical protein [Mycolicibacterium hodleri]|uniref:Lipoprotein n=1 Tax=Mycolicibacterium hodleri TaxID=49897 RepID=A0A502EB89_9MYCO|nr:hypothetical protein [Mycolicibacterium hodleri]TPG34995.1 hypothetical protein EAH80_09325 [Mycolicibacterium hodleri]